MLAQKMFVHRPGRAKEAEPCRIPYGREASYSVPGGSTDILEVGHLPFYKNNVDLIEFNEYSCQCS